MSDHITSEPAPALRETVGDGKYTVIVHHDGHMEALRYGQPWRDLTGDGLVCALAHEVESLREKLQAAEADASIHRTRLGSVLWSGALDHVKCGEVQQWASEYDRDAARYRWMRTALAGVKWTDVSALESVFSARDEDEKYITPTGLDRTIDSVLGQRSQ